MNRVIELVREFALLQEERFRNGGALPASREERWEELAGFCSRMLSLGGQANAVGGGGWTRASLRVPAEVDMFFQCRGEYYAGQLVNLSRGGIFLGSPALMAVGSPLQLFLTNLGRAALLETRGEVVWTCEKSLPSSTLPRGMGVRFVEFSDPLARQMEAFVFETLESRLAKLDLTAVDPRLFLGPRSAC